MLRTRRASVVEVTAERPGALELVVEVGGERAAAIAYPELTGPVGQGDDVLVNTTAVQLGLGTGGFHFVVAMLSRRESDGGSREPPGRVMKARYTPLQVAVRSVEETHGPAIDASAGLQGTPVVVAPLHSMVAPVAAGAKASGAGRVAYVMTDGSALAGPFSRLVPALRDAGFLDGSITCGQAFGGDLEAVTVWTALLAAREVLGADVVVVADGPGNTGTNTKWGATALGAGHALDAASVLGGRPVAALRMSFADPRERHRGISHHSMTILREVCTTRTTVAVPSLDPAEHASIAPALDALRPRHDLVTADGRPALDRLREAGVRVTSMGRGVDDDPAFFLAAGAAGVVAGELAAGQPPR